MRFSVTVEDVVAWNGLTDAALADGQVVFLWPHADVSHTPELAAAAPAPRSSSGGAVRRSTGSGAAAAGGAEPPPLVDAGETISGDPGVGNGVVVVRADVPTAPVRNAGLLAVDTSGSDLDLASGPSLQRSGGVAQGTGLGTRSGSLGGGGEVDELEVRRTELRNLGPKIPNTPVTPPRMSKPAAKACLKGAASTVSEQGIVQSAGLSNAQVKAGMSTVTRVLPRCFPKGTEGTYQVIVEVTVGCDGRVSNVFTVSPGVVPSHVTSCIEQTLGYASFDAHGMPAGAAFQYPMTFTF